MSLLSIVVPSRRSLEQSRFSLETALIYAEKRDAVVIVSDNSADPAKAAWLKQQGKRVRYISSEAEDGVSNLLNALAYVQTPFLLPFADDDAIYGLDDRPPLDLSQLPPDVIGVRPQTMNWRNDQGVVDVITASLDGDTPSERISQYSASAGGNNALYYSIYRSALFAGVLKAFGNHHPTRGAYCDWSFIVSFLCCGKMLYDPALIYCYDLGQWNTSETAEASVNSLFRQAGLPETAWRFHHFLMFLDVHSLLCWRHLPLRPMDRDDAMSINIKVNLEGFRKRVARDPDLYSQEVKDAVGALGAETDPDRLFTAILPVADILKPGLANGYRRFFASLTEGCP